MSLTFRTAEVDFRLRRKFETAALLCFGRRRRCDKDVLSRCIKRQALGPSTHRHLRLPGRHWDLNLKIDAVSLRLDQSPNSHRSFWKIVPGDARVTFI